MEATIQKTIREAYKAANPADKKDLETKFGKEFFDESSWRTFDTWEKVASKLNLHPENSLPFKKPTNNREIATNAFFMADAITEVLLEGSVLDWSNGKQKKWGFWLTDYKPGSGFRFDGAGYDWTATDTFGGARLYLDTEDKIIFFGKTFLPIINQLCNPIK